MWNFIFTRLQSQGEAQSPGAGDIKSGLRVADPVQDVASRTVAALLVASRDATDSRQHGGFAVLPVASVRDAQGCVDISTAPYSDQDTQDAR